MIEVLRKINQRLKAYKKKKNGEFLSPVRRIERVAPTRGRRVVSMTFDDGPTNIKTKGGLPLTEYLMDSLEKYDAKGTFDSIGSTAQNYPDAAGKLHTASWGGTRHDHYPDIYQDSNAGVVNLPEISKRIATSHGFANHSYSHVLFGPLRLIYAQRAYMPDLKTVVEDLLKLNNIFAKEYQLGVALSRPPHYVDGIPGGKTAYDAYAYLGMNYMAASFDGGGWKPSCGDYFTDVRNMIDPIKKALETDPDSLNGQIIFQKDGYNMSKETPVADALEAQLRLLRDHDYEIITVQELLSISPFEDLAPGEDGFDSAKALIDQGYIAAYKNNSFQPNRILNHGELITMTTPKSLYMARLRLLTDLENKSAKLVLPADQHILYDELCENIGEITSQNVKIKQGHPYYLNYQYAKFRGVFSGENSYLESISPKTPVDLKAFAAVTGIDTEALTAEALVFDINLTNPLSRRNAAKLLARFLDR